MQDREKKGSMTIPYNKMSWKDFQLVLSVTASAPANISVVGMNAELMNQSLFDWSKLHSSQWGTKPF